MGNAQRATAMKQNILQRGVALSLCCLLLQLPLGAQEYPNPDMVGAVLGVTPGVMINQSRLISTQNLQKHDLLSTDNTGRVKVRLRGGPVLDIGSQTQVRIEGNNPISQQTVVQLVSGRLRSEVTKFMVNGGQYEVKVPQGSAQVRDGADFFLEASPSRSVLTVYSGIVIVGGGKRALLDVAGGQTVELGPAGVGPLSLTNEEIEQTTMAETSLRGVASQSASREMVESEPKPAGSSHMKRNLIIVGIAGAAAVGALAGMRGGKSSTTTTTPTPTTPSGPVSIPAN